MKKKKVLIVIQLVRRGGVELVAINFAKQLDKNKFDITFLLVNSKDAAQDEQLLCSLKKDGFKFIEMPTNVTGYLGKYRYLAELMNENKYDIVHSHVMLFSGIICVAAKKNNVKIRAAHSHTIQWNHNENFKYKVYKFVMQRLLSKYSTHKFACSKKAGEFLYGKSTYEKSGIFIANGVDTEKYIYSPETGIEIRNEFGISKNDILIGHIGTIYSVKNQVFLVEIIAEMKKINKNIKCIMVGEELERDIVAEKAKSLDVTENVIFAGQRNDVNKILQAMDIMIFPSLFEALPVSLIEAQASKLPCLISDAVTTEVKFNDNVDFMGLDCSAEQWANRAFDLLDIDRNSITTEELAEVYDIHSVCKKLETFYLS